MADFIDTVNFLEIQNAKQGTKAESRLRDLEGKADYLKKKTGYEPSSWYEFKEQLPKDKTNHVGNALMGAGIGTAAMVGLASAGFMPFVPAILIGVVIGGLFGSYHETENTSRARQVDAYEKYLSEFEQSKGRSRAQQNSLMHEFDRIGAQESKFAQQLDHEREKPCSCGRGK